MLGCRGTISADVNGKDATGPLEIASTCDPGDPLAWRQWYRWNLTSHLFKVRLNKGKNVLTVHILTRGNMSLGYFDFEQAHRGTECASVSSQCYAQSSCVGNSDGALALLERVGFR
jgi:hypothetical protein